MKANIIHCNAFAGDPLCSIVWHFKGLASFDSPTENQQNSVVQYSTVICCFVTQKNITMPVYFKLRTAGPSSQAQASPPCTTCPAPSGSEPK